MMSNRAIIDSMACRPWWSPAIGALSTKLIQPPGCGVENGFVPCNPSELRAYTEAWLNKNTPWRGPLPLMTYSLARNISTEQGNQSPENKVALALSTLGQARRRGVDVHKLITTNRIAAGTYGQINYASAETEQAVGRWTASSRAPSLQDIAVAHFVLAGGAGMPGDADNFARGADDQAAARIFSEAKFKAFAKEGSFWVGYVPGVDPKAIVLMRKMPYRADSTAGKALLQRSIDMLNSPTPDWTNMATCPRGVGPTIEVASSAAFGAAALAALTAVIKSAPIALAL